MSQNPLHSIIREIIQPQFDRLSFEAEGIVTSANYMAQTVDVRWRDHLGALFRAKGVPVPKDADGIYREAIEIGQRVKLGFQDGDHYRPFVSMVYTGHASQSDYYSKCGAPVMRGTNYILGSD